MSNRTEQEITADIVSAKDAYIAAVETEPRAVVEAASARLRTFQAELSQALSAGAESPCTAVIDGAECGGAVHGMLRRPEIRDGAGNLKAAALYEVGCLSCPARSVASSPEAAVKEWNAGKRGLPTVA
jgi:hypothetical protein